MEVKEEPVELKKEPIGSTQDYGVQISTRDYMGDQWEAKEEYAQNGAVIDDDYVEVLEDSFVAAQDYYGVQANYLEELQLARLSRVKLAKFVHTPFFSKTVVGAFVRIGVGPIPGRYGCNYRIAQILDVVEVEKVYNLEDTRTNKALKLRMGTEDRLYRLEYVTNMDFVHAEFQDWLTIMKRLNQPIPTIDEIRKKQEEITAADNHTYTDEDVSAIIEEKAKFKEIPKIKPPSGEIIRLGQKRSGGITAIDSINKRNRTMKESYSGENKTEELGLNTPLSSTSEVASTIPDPTNTPNTKGRRISLADYKKRKMEAQTPQE